MLPLLGMAGGLALTFVGFGQMSGAVNPLLAVGCLLGGPVLGLSGGVLLENRLQNRFAGPLLEKQEALESRVRRLEEALAQQTKGT